MSVRFILIRKGSKVYTIEPTASLADAAASLTGNGIGALVVINAQDQVVGMISERDIVRELSAKGTAALAMPVAEVMTHEVEICHYEDDLVDLLQRMTKGKFRHCPVIEDGRLVGIVSIGDVVKFRLEELEEESRTLREYIHRGVRHLNQF